MYNNDIAFVYKYAFEPSELTPFPITLDDEVMKFRGKFIHSIGATLCNLF